MEITYWLFSAVSIPNYLDSLNKLIKPIKQPITQTMPESPVIPSDARSNILPFTQPRLIKRHHARPPRTARQLPHALQRVIAIVRRDLPMHRQMDPFDDLGDPRITCALPRRDTTSSA